MRISEFDYDLPEELIAQQPLERRDASRMLVVDRNTRSWTESTFASFPELVEPRDVIVINNTRVFPARLRGRRVPSGGQVEILLVHQTAPDMWEALLKPARRFPEGTRISLGDPRLHATVVRSLPGGLRELQFESDQSIEALIEELGETPLPPYIRRPPGGSQHDRERYQTIFASEKGAIAAPTAGFHFTPEVISALRQRGVKIAEITLHVGYGTFEPVRVEQIEHHQVAAETFQISEAAASTINAARAKGGRVIAVGTTTTRALETLANNDGTIAPGRGTTALTIKPGYTFRAVEALLTNFHLPQSSLLLLVSAFADRELVLDAYRYAVKAKFRFYSYGDCMFVI